MSEHPGYHDARVRVRYAETDQMGVVYHANYLVWFEVGRVELMRSLGFDYKQMEADDGIGIAVVGVTVRYKSPAKYDDELLVRTRIHTVRGPLIKFGYQVLRTADEALLCDGETTHVVVDKSMKRAPLPAKYETAMQAILVEKS